MSGHRKRAIRVDIHPPAPGPVRHPSAVAHTGAVLGRALSPASAPVMPSDQEREATVGSVGVG